MIRNILLQRTISLIESYTFESIRLKQSCVRSVHVPIVRRRHGWDAVYMWKVHWRVFPWKIGVQIGNRVPIALVKQMKMVLIQYQRNQEQKALCSSLDSIRNKAAYNHRKQIVIDKLSSFRKYHHRFYVYIRD